MTQTAPALRIVKERLHPGQLIGARYQLVKTVGEGGCGQVWLAEDKRTRTWVALKFPLDDLGQNTRSRFDSELRVLSHLPKHPHLVPLLDHGEEDGQPYLVMEYIPLSLADWLEEHRLRQQFPDAKTVYRLFTEIADGVGEAHTLTVPGPVVHRDINPSNIMLSETLHGALSAKVLDFGIARLGERRATATGQTLGTPGYMPPEQANSQPTLLGPRSDVFSLGILAFEMLCLHHDSPIPGLPLACFAVQHTSSLLGYLTRCRADIPQAAWQVIARAIQPQIACRYSDAVSLGFAWVKATYVHDEPHPNPVPSCHDAVVSAAIEDAVTQPFHGDKTKITSHAALAENLDPTDPGHRYRFQRWWRSVREAWSHGQR